MKAIETVISRDKLDQICRDKAGESTFIPDERDRRQVQAEISFKAGQDSRLKEVKEWLDAHKSYYGCSTSYLCWESSPEEFEAFLKGLEGDKK